MGKEESLDLVKGSLDVLILKALSRGPAHGYAISRWIRRVTREALSIEEGKLRLRRAYLDRMLKAIPPRKAARFYQIDNKLDAVVRADVAKQIPLAP